MNYIKMNSEQIKVVTNAIQVFEAFTMEHDHENRFKGSMHWKKIGGREYLYRAFSGGRNNSLGPRSAETENTKNSFDAGKAEHKLRISELGKQMKIQAGYVKINRLNRFTKVGASVIRSFQRAKIPYRLIGTNALYAYEISAGVLFMPELLATDDLDLLMDDRQGIKIAAKLKSRTLLSLLKSADKSFKRLSNSRYEFAAVNNKGFRVELISQGRQDLMQETDFEKQLDTDDLQPIGINTLKWFLASPHYSEVVFDENGMPLKISTVDPRAFALYKHYTSKKSDRHPGKRRRDAEHARAVAHLVKQELQHLPEGSTLAKLFPDKLVANGNSGLEL